MITQGVQGVVALFIIKDNKILLAKHVKPEETFYTLIGGRIEPGEVGSQAAIREAHEEAGITVTDLVYAHTVSRKVNDAVSSVVIFFHVQAWEGEPHNHEPHIHAEVSWHALNNLPSSLRVHHRQAYMLWKEGIYYSEAVPS
jgi:8-oxo-dGTP diphosphatase